MEVNVNRNDKKAFFENFNNEKNSSSYTQNFSQIIYYGVPGSGKSHKINEQTKSLPDEQKMRVVFHPEYTNADFVGQILPVQTNGGLEYPFKAGPFTRILKRALKNPDKPYYLIIEEINRGNAAAIFGDLFQLLDRNSDGWSSYSIENLDINAFIRSEDERYSDKTPPTTKKVGNIEFNENTSLRLPPNLSLLATMNTSDQNVFTLDNAFQRRWDMRLVENQFDDKDENAKIQRTAEIGGTNVTWEQFQTHINKRIGEMSSSMGMSSMEDKRLGCWFVKAEDGKISKEQFAEKVLKYLWDDAFKFSREEIFDIKDKTSSLESIVSAFKNGDESAPCNWTIFKNTSFISQLDNVQAESDVGETE
ncbi:AAA family ATPase [Treponema ruminis]|uniref:5-methylcytosine-specific restriction endonuclease McrBC GTP-binding regulatory subunit McrB n=1 Tax=Treponema ruminis TaxID=744515 RepID=A0A7W8GAL7_9SPIR|nr:AAA family ATPase [Treponema ruminis]MBB5226842.1 5-methylcytosine-specific restriction endonuclease McrBC GTP-binding regulatory subunit McrB [Treponema ruminis]